MPRDNNLRSAAAFIADAQLERKLIICARKLLMRQEERGFGRALRNTGVAVCDRGERPKTRGAKPSLMAGTPAPRPAAQRFAEAWKTQSASLDACFGLSELR